MKRMSSPLAAGMIVLAAWGAPLWGQAGSSAQISGVISNPSGGLVPNATVTATHIDTGLVRTARSGPDGIYLLPNLPAGSCKLEVQASGFETYVQTGILLQVSNNVTINVTLHVGQVKQEVQVSANASMVQTQTSCQSNGVARTIVNPSTGHPFANDFVNPAMYDAQALTLLN